MLGVLKMNPGSRLVPIDANERRAPSGPAPAYAGPPRRPAPDFRPPSEWLDGGVRRAYAKSCADKQGRLQSVGMQEGVHPRLMGATIDWLRRFEYDAYLGGTFTEFCETVYPRFDRAVVPASPQGRWPSD